MRRNNRRNWSKRNQDDKLKKQITLMGGAIIIFIIIISIMIFNLNKPKQMLTSSTEDLKQEVNVAEDINENKEEVKQEIEEKEKKVDTSFTLTAIGDVLCHNTQYQDAYIKEKDEYDFSYVFEDIKNYIEEADISIGSLETSFAGKERGYSNYPRFNSPDNLAYSLKNVGLDILSTAGNHCIDMGFSGLSRTIDVLDEAGISHVGTYKTQEERDTILFKDVKGIKIAFLNYTYGTNGIPVPSDKSFCVNLIDKNLIEKDIEKAKSQNADIIVSCMHWGTEYKTTVNNKQKELADFLFKKGVNVILGNHPHVLEPMEKRRVTLEDGTTKDGFIIYALGNFICDQNAENTRNSIILNLKITKSAEGKISIDSANYVPIHMYKNKSVKLRRMKVLDIEKTINDYEVGNNKDIGKSKYEYLKIQLEKIKKIVGSEI